jgi:hypothetical protein
MKLVYASTGFPVKVGDVVRRGGETYRVAYFRPPHKPASSGHVTVECNGQQQEFYVNIIGAVWIEREDRT